MPISSSIPSWPWAVALTLMLLLVSTEGVPLDDDPKYLKVFKCNDKHNTELRFRCATVEKDGSGNDLCAGDRIQLGERIGTFSYDPCQYSTCLGVKCPPEAPYLMQIYATGKGSSGGTTIEFNYIIPRSNEAPRCGCSAAVDENVADPPPPLYVSPDGPESQPDDAVCQPDACGSMERFAHSPSGTGDDCTCCDKPTDKLSLVPPLPGATYAGCDPVTSDSSSSDHNTDPSDAFVSTVRSMCGSAAASVSDSDLVADMARFCCSFATGGDGSNEPFFCGLDVVRVAASLAVPAEAQCRSNIANQQLSCCATVSAKGEQIANKGTTCSRGPGGGDGALSPRPAAAACIMLLSAAWMAL